MREDSPDAEQAIITKVGAVVVRHDAGHPQVLAIQPKPKPRSPEDLPPIGMVRGTRMYRNSEGVFVDANHDGRTIEAGVEFEPVHETLAREIEEEAGVTAAMLREARVIDMGPRVFASTKKVPYPIHWFVVVVEERAELPHTGFKDSLHSEWLSLEQFKDYVEMKKASRGYIAVIEEALTYALQTSP